MSLAVAACSVASIGSTESAHQGSHIAEMKNLLPLVDFVVITNNPDADESLFIELRAVSADEARRIARSELAKTRRDHYSIDAVLECA